MNFLKRYVSVALLGSLGIFLGLWTRVEDSAIANPTSRPDDQVVPNRIGVFADQNCDPAVVKFSARHTVPITIREQDGATTLPPGESFSDRWPTEAGRHDSGNWLPSITQPINKADLTCSADGPLAEVLVAEGQEVEKGQKLALIDNRIALASVEAARSTAEKQASLRSARVKVTLAQQYLARLKVAASKNAASGVELDEAESRLEEALSQVNEGLEALREAQARLSVETARLNAHDLVAPFGGTVVKIHKHVGETVGRDQVVVSLVDVRKLRAEVFVPVDQISVLRDHETVSLIAELPGRPRITGTVVHIAPLIDAATKTVRAVVEIDNQERALPSGFSILIDFSFAAVSPKVDTAVPDL
jgi:RND family efflux transporter MFP subunit